MFISLAQLVKELEEDTKELPLLSSFSCSQDKDIEHFLHNRDRAIRFEKQSKARTYLVFNQDEMTKKKISDLTIYGYITVAIKVLTVPPDASKSIRKKLDGLSATIHGELIDDFPCYLIGQLARNSNVPSSSLKGKTLLDFAQDIVGQAVDAVGGRYILIECKDSQKLVRFYEENGFKGFSRMTYDCQTLVQMMKKI